MTVPTNGQEPDVARESDIADIKPWLPPNRPNTSNNYRRLQAHRRLLVWAYHVEALAAKP